jgi:hypothetical protein
VFVLGVDKLAGAGGGRGALFPFCPPCCPFCPLHSAIVCGAIKYFSFGNRREN